MCGSKMVITMRQSSIQGTHIKRQMLNRNGEKVYAKLLTIHCMVCTGTQSGDMGLKILSDLKLFQNVHVARSESKIYITFSKSFKNLNHNDCLLQALAKFTCPQAVGICILTPLQTHQFSRRQQEAIVAILVYENLLSPIIVLHGCKSLQCPWRIVSI